MANAFGVNNFTQTIVERPTCALIIEHELDLIDTAINFKKCLCLRIGQRFDIVSANKAIAIMAKPSNGKLN